MSSRKAPAQQEIDEEYLRSLMAAPEPAASSSDTEVSEQAETPASEPRVRRSDAEDYASRFLKNTPSEARQCVYIDRRLHRKITTLVGVAGNRRLQRQELHRQRIGTALRAAPDGNTVALLQRTQ